MGKTMLALIIALACQGIWAYLRITEQIEAPAHIILIVFTLLWQLNYQKDE